MSGISLLHPPSFALSDLAVITQTDLSVQMFTHLCNSLWLGMSMAPPLSVFIPELLSSVYVSFLVFVSLETPSQVTYAANVLPVFLHPSPLNYGMNVSTNFLMLLLVKIASTNEQSVPKLLHLLLHDYTIVRCL